MKVYNPYNKKEIGEIIFSSRAEALKKVEKVRGAKSKMQALSSGEKSSILKDIIVGIESHFDELVTTIVKESGKPYKYAKGEVYRAIQTFTIAAEECKRMPHELFDLDATPKGKGLKGELVYYPKGVILGISPFNFPINLVAHKVAPAIACGCPILLKPSEKTPLTAELLAKIIASTFLPKGGFELIHCENEITKMLVEHPNIDVLSFTGSAKVGWQMKSWSGKKHVVLELGGNAAAILAKDADIEKAAEELIVGGYAYSGQVCIHTQRIYAHHSVMSKFLQIFKKKIKALKVGNPMEESTEVGVMINEENAKRVEEWVKEARMAEAAVIVGGKRVGAFYYPTLLTRVPKGQKVREEEIFGPVVDIESFSNIEDAFEQVNASKWGLQASIFTDSVSTRNQAFKQLQVGAVIHNKSTTFRVDDMPYGGVKDSGFGREGVRYAFKDYLTPKLLVRE